MIESSPARRGRGCGFQRRRCGLPRRICGFTLIELLVACALMAVLALLSWRGLDSILQTRERLVIASDELRSLTLAFSQMDEDLLKSWPVNLLKLDESYLSVAVGGEQNAQSLHLIREVNPSGFPTRVQRVVYEVRGRQLARGFSEYGRAQLIGGGVGGTAVQSMVWQPILPGVRSITIRGWVDGRGWLDASNLAGIEQARVRMLAAERRAGGAAGAAASGAAGGAAGGAAAVRGGVTGSTAGGAAAGGSAGAQAASEAARRAQLAAQAQLSISGIEIVLERVDGQRFLRVYSVKD